MAQPTPLPPRRGRLKGDALQIEKAVIDRFEGLTAIVLVGDEEKMVNLPLDRLPTGAKEGDWLKLTLIGGQVTSVTPDPEETQRRRRLIEAKLEQLRKKRRQ